MEAIGTMGDSLCKVEPDPIFVYPIPGSPYPATANFKITNVACHKIAYKIRYGNKHPNMDIRIGVDNKGTLSPGQHLGVPVSLMPGYDVNKDESDSFTFCVYAMPLYTINNFRLGENWYKEAHEEDFDFHALDCHIKQQAAPDGTLPVNAIEPSFHEERVALEGMLMDRYGNIYPDPNVSLTHSARQMNPSTGDANGHDGQRQEDTGSGNRKKKGEESNKRNVAPGSTKKTPPSLPLIRRVDTMRLMRRNVAQWKEYEARRKEYEEELVREADEEYIAKAKKKSREWVEKSRPHFGTHEIDEEYHEALARSEHEIENDSFSGISGADQLRDASFVCTPEEEYEVMRLDDFPEGTAPLVMLDRRLADLSALNEELLQLLKGFIAE